MGRTPPLSRRTDKSTSTEKERNRVALRLFLAENEAVHFGNLHLNKEDLTGSFPCCFKGGGGTKVLNRIGDKQTQRCSRYRDTFRRSKSQK